MLNVILLSLFYLTTDGGDSSRKTAVYQNIIPLFQYDQRLVVYSSKIKKEAFYKRTRWKKIIRNHEYLVGLAARNLRIRSGDSLRIYHQAHESLDVGSHFGFRYRWLSDDSLIDLYKSHPNQKITTYKMSDTTEYLLNKSFIDIFWLWGRDEGFVTSIRFIDPRKEFGSDIIDDFLIVRENYEHSYGTSLNSGKDVFYYEK